MSARFDERLAERTRIARELHDTFLQTVQGSKLVVDDAARAPGTRRPFAGSASEICHRSSTLFLRHGSLWRRRKQAARRGSQKYAESERAVCGCRFICTTRLMMFTPFSKFSNRTYLSLCVSEAVS
ncbi:MAG TPA: histidine kinase [Terriglobales bacterium]